MENSKVQGNSYRNAPEGGAHEAVEKLQKILLAEVPVAASVRDGEEVTHLRRPAVETAVGLPFASAHVMHSMH